MKHHNFVIGKGEDPEAKIQNEINVLRESNVGFMLTGVKVMPSQIGTSLATIEYTHS